VSCLIFYGDWVGWMFVYLLTWLKSSTSISGAVWLELCWLDSCKPISDFNVRDV
jgi:hypothetical protein